MFIPIDLFLLIAHQNVSFTLSYPIQVDLLAKLVKNGIKPLFFATKLKCLSGRCIPIEVQRVISHENSEKNRICFWYFLLLKFYVGIIADSQD